MKILLFLALFASKAFADGACVTDLSGAQKLLGDKHSSTTWIETTANDHKPLFIQLSSKDKKLYLYYFKTKEGPWAEGLATICPKDKKPKLTAQIKKEDITIGKAAPSMIRWSFKSGVEFTLTPNDDKTLKITTFGWGGTFVPSTEKDLTDARAQVK